MESLVINAPNLQINVLSVISDIFRYPIIPKIVVMMKINQLIILKIKINILHVILVVLNVLIMKKNVQNVIKTFYP